MALVLHAHAAKLRLRIIAPDRPGYGGASPHPGRSVDSYCDDLAHLLAALGVGRVGLLASSAGSMVRVVRHRSCCVPARSAGVIASGTRHALTTSHVDTPSHTVRPGHDAPPCDV